ncbi:MAG: DUF503 domain-containing protein [Halanaerobium sp.]|nr:DUF503 domain-containing protein [Halanaerobium sp.]
MKIGICKVEIFIPGVRSLKEKRGIIKSVMKRLQNRFNLSISEVANHDSWQKTTWGIAIISTDAPHVHRTLERVMQYLYRERMVEVVDREIEIL